MLRTLFGAILAWAMMSVGAFAQQPPSPERLALAREVMMLSGGEAAFTGVMEAMRPMMIQDLRQRGLSEDVAQRFVTMFIEEFSQEAPEFIELGAIAYANAFTDEELRGIAAFLRTPAGHAMVEHQGEIAAAMARAGAVIGEQSAARVAARMQVSPPHQP